MIGINESAGKTAQNVPNAPADRNEKRAIRRSGYDADEPVGPDSGWQLLLAGLFETREMESEKVSKLVEGRPNAGDTPSPQASFGDAPPVNPPSSALEKTASYWHTNQNATGKNIDSATTMQDLRNLTAAEEQGRDNHELPTLNDVKRRASMKRRLPSIEEQLPHRGASIQVLPEEVIRRVATPCEAVPSAPNANCIEPASIAKQSVPSFAASDAVQPKVSELAKADVDDRVQVFAEGAQSAKGTSENTGDVRSSVDSEVDKECCSVDLPSPFAALVMNRQEGEVHDSRLFIKGTPASVADSSATLRFSMRSQASSVRFREHGVRNAGPAVRSGEGAVADSMRTAVSLAELTIKISPDASFESERPRTANLQKMPDPAEAGFDRQGLSPDQHWTHAGKRIAEAGFQDSTLGWVCVRAERDSTGLRAVVVPASHGAEKILSAHLSGLNAHLTANNILAAPVTISAAHESSMISSNGGENQRGGSEPRGQDGRKPNRRPELELAQTAPSSSRNPLMDINHFDRSSFHADANSFNGLHVSLVA